MRKERIIYVFDGRIFSFVISKINSAEFNDQVSYSEEFKRGQRSDKLNIQM